MHHGRLVAAALGAFVLLAEVTSGQTTARNVALNTAPPAAISEPEPELVAVVLELRLGEVASVTVPAFRFGEEALIPLVTLLRVAEVRTVFHDYGAIEAVMQPGNIPLLVGLADQVMAYGARRVPIARDLKLLRGRELYVSARVFAELIQIPVDVSWSDLTVWFPEVGSLPVARRIARLNARRRLLANPAESTGPALSYALRRPPLDGLVVDYTIVAPTANLGGTSYSVAAGVNAFGGSLDGTVSGAGASSARPMLYTGGWSGVWATNPYVKQVRLGDAVGTGPAARQVRGGMITNSPYVRPTRFDVDGFRGVVGPRWEIEAYRYGRLVAFDSANGAGQYSIPIPTEYGENPLEFVAYGPHGEVRHFNRLYRVAGDLIPAGQVEYGLSAGQCVYQRCLNTANVDVRYGVTPRWTVRAGYDGFQSDSTTMLSHPYAGVVGSLTDALGVQADATLGASVRGIVRYEPSLRLRLAGEYTQFMQTNGIPILTSPDWRSRWVASALVRPGDQASATYFETDAAFIETTNGTTLRARLIASTQWRELRASPYLRFERDAARTDTAQARSFVGLNASLIPRSSWRLLGRTWLRATVEAAQQGGVSDASFWINQQIRRDIRIEAGARRLRNETILTLVAAIDLATVRSYTTAYVPQTGRPTTSQFLQGSIVVNTAARGIGLNSGPSLQRSGVAGRVFLDHNSNGLVDPGESLLKDVTVRVGAVAAETDPRGQFEVWNITPYEPALVTVDSSSLPSPLWIPRFGIMTVVPGPNRFVLVDIPIVPAGAVEGRVMVDGPDGRQPIGNALVTLIDAQTGHRRTVTTFTDGEFIAIGVRPGTYEVTLDKRFLDQLEVTAPHVRFTLQPSADGTTVKNVDIVLVRAGAAR